MDKAKLAKKILNKFNEPRAIAKRSGTGTELAVEGLPAGRKITGSTDEEALKAYGAMYGGPETSEKIVKEMAAEAGAKKEKMLEQNFAERQKRKTTENPAGAEDTDVLGFADKAVKMAGKPQRVILQKLAQKLGKQGSAEDSEKSSQDIVEAVAEKLGLPESAASNALKAAGVAGLEVFADPLAAVPVGKIAKAVKSTQKLDDVVRKARLEKVINVLRSKVSSTADSPALRGAKKYIVPANKIIKSRP